MDNTKRFSDRVQDYIRYRPEYPEELLTFLQLTLGLDSSFIVADIGSGTGISSLLFLKNGNLVYAVEPNQEMRAAQEIQLSHHENFQSIDGTAEHTNLETDHIDLIFCGQAFHWFQKEQTKTEFKRILKKDGNIVLVWNSRSLNSSFQKEYEQILYDCIDAYKYVNHKNIPEEEIIDFFAPRPMRKKILSNQQMFDLIGLKGRLLSSSYCPKSGLEHERLMKEIETLFYKHQQNSQITFYYETHVYYTGDLLIK